MTVSYGVLFVLSETLDFAVANQLYVSIVALLSFYVGLEVSGLGIVCQIVYTRRNQKLNDDVVRVRELQQQLGVLRTVRSKRNSEKNQSEKAAEPIKPDEKKASKKKSIDISALKQSDATVGPKASAGSSTGTAATDGSSLAISKDDVEDGGVNNEVENASEDGPGSNVYESVKDAWTWGRHETPFSHLLGIAEGLTSKTIGLFGTDLKGLDDALKPCVADLDDHVLKPTLSNVSSFFNDTNTPESEGEEIASGIDAGQSLLTTRGTYTQ